MRARPNHARHVACSLLATMWLALLVCVASAAEPEQGPPLLPPPGNYNVIPQPLPEVPESPGTDPASSSPEGSQEATEGAADSVVIETPPPLPHWYEPAFWFCDCWDAGFEFGLNGVDRGANETVNHRAGAHLRRKTKAWKFDSNFSYNRNYANKIETQNNAQHDARVDRMFGESPWSLFAAEQLQYDEFQAFDLRLSLNTGVGYEFYETETFDLSGRFGAGVSHEFGGPDESVPRRGGVRPGVGVPHQRLATVEGQGRIFP